MRNLLGVILYEHKHIGWFSNPHYCTFKWLVTWKRGLYRPKLSFENLSPLPALSYTITKKQKVVFLQHRSHWGSWGSWESSLIGFIFRFHSDRVLFSFFIDRILFRVLSDRVFFESSAISFSSEIGVIDSSLGHQCSFCAMLLFFFFFFIKSFYYFFIKNRSFYDNIFSKRSLHSSISLTCFNNFNKIDSQIHDRDKNTEVVDQRCSVKKVFLGISKNSQENTCAWDSFLIKLQA